MFEFLKGLFKQEVEKQEVNVSEISTWFSGSTKQAFEGLNTELENDFEEIRGLLNNLKNDLSVLEKAEIKDEDKIQDKIKHIVLGHRASYVRVLSHFVDSIDIPEKIDYEEGNRTCFDIEESLNQIAKTTVKSYQAVQHLFHSELEKITKYLKRLNDLLKQIRERIQKSKVVEIDKIKKEISLLINSIEKKKNISIELREKGSNLLETENSKKEIEDKIKEIKQGKDFSRLEEYSRELEETGELIRQKENETLQLFSPLETGLKKFKRITLEHEKMVGDYADSAMKALLKDKEFKIVEILESMKKSILSGGIDLRDRKREKTLKGIEYVFPQKLKSIVSEYNSLLEQKEDIRRNQSSNPAKSNLKELEYKLEHTLFNLKKLKEDVELTEKKYGHINIESLKKGLEEQIKETVNIEVSIIL
ncbi:hypothetical protein GOV06_05370 [Candidatus Woesearchaeota archaeon]|nr:hypothetical protein [Candidatus Woesearchaeota archaeon]